MEPREISCKHENGVEKIKIIRFYRPDRIRLYKNNKPIIEWKIEDFGSILNALAIAQSERLFQ